MISSIEKETIITFNESENECEIYTYNKALIKKLEPLCAEFPEIYQKVSEDKFGGVTFRSPKKNLKINFRRPMSENRRKELAVQLEYARSKIKT